MTQEKAGLSPEAILAMLGLAVLYPALGWLGFAIAGRVGNEVAFWCASSVWIATLMATPRQHWRPVMVTGVVAVAFLLLILHAPLLPAAAFLLSEALAVPLAARLVSRLGSRRRATSSLLARQLLLILAAALLHALLLSPTGAWLLATLEHSPRYTTAWLGWIGTSLAGAAIALPFVALALPSSAQEGEAAQGAAPAWLGWLCLAGLAGSSWVIAGTGGIRWGWEATLGWITYLPLVCAVFLALVWPQRGAAIATAALASLEMVFLFYGEALLGAHSLPGDQATQLRWYLAAAALLSSVTAALTIEIRRLLAQVEQWKNRYEATLTDAKLLQYEVQLPSMGISWTGNTVAHFGVDYSEIASVDQWNARIHADDRSRLSEYMQAVAAGDESPPDLRVRALLAGGHYAPVIIKVSSVTVYEGAIASVRGTVQLAGGRKRGRLKLYRQEVPAADRAGPLQHPAVMMIHGIGGSEHDFGPLYKALGAKGFDPQPLTLPGHRGHPEDLLRVHAEDWILAATQHYQNLCERYQTVHIMGISLGALIALEVASSAPTLKGKLVLISAPVFIDGWAVPWYYALRYPLYRLSLARKMIKVEEEDPFGVKDARIRAIVADKFARGESYHYSYVPLGCVQEIDRLRKRLQQSTARPDCQTLVIHSYEDDLTSARSAEWLRGHLGRERTQLVLLNNSYHMVCIDNERGIVADSILRFLADEAAPQKT